MKLEIFDACIQDPKMQEYVISSQNRFDIPELLMVDFLLSTQSWDYKQMMFF